MTTATQQDALQRALPASSPCSAVRTATSRRRLPTPGTGVRDARPGSCGSSSTARSTRSGCRSEAGSSRLRAGGGLRPDQLRQLRLRRRARAPRVGRSRGGRRGPRPDRVGRGLARRARIRRGGRRRQQGPGAATEQGDPVPDPADPAPGADRRRPGDELGALRRRGARVRRRSTSGPPMDRRGRSRTCDGRGRPRSCAAPVRATRGRRSRGAWRGSRASAGRRPRGDRAEAARGGRSGERRAPAVAERRRLRVLTLVADLGPRRWWGRASRAPDRRAGSTPSASSARSA